MGDVHPKRPAPIKDWIAAVGARPNIKVVERLREVLELLGQRVERGGEGELAELGRAIAVCLVELLEAAAEGNKEHVAASARKLGPLVNRMVDHPDIHLAKQQRAEKKHFQRSGADANAKRALRVSQCILAGAQQLLRERPEGFRTASSGRIKLTPLAQALEKKGIRDPEDPGAKRLAAGTIAKHLSSHIKAGTLR